MKIKVAFIFKNYLNSPGGAQRELTRIANLLSEDNRFDVSIIGLDFPGGKLYFRVAPTVNLKFLSSVSVPVSTSDKTVLKFLRKVKFLAPKILHKLGLLNILYKLSHFVLSSNLYKALWGKRYNKLVDVLALECEDVKYDVILPIMPNIQSIVYKMLEKLSYKPKIILTHRNFPPVDYYPKYGRWDILPDDIFYRVQSLMNADKIIVQILEFKQTFFDIVRQVPNLSFDDVECRVIAIPNVVEEQFSSLVDYQNTNIIYAARLEPVKNVDVLIKAFKQVLVGDCTVSSDWHLTICGTGSEEERLQKLIEYYELDERVTLKGFVENIHDEYQKASFCVFPSQFEGFPNALAEAMSHGLACIGFEETPGVNSLIKHGNNGLLVRNDINGIESLSNAMRKMIESVKFRGTLGQNAKKSMINYNEEYVLNLWIDTISSVYKQN